jgi:hypothetical protein
MPENGGRPHSGLLSRWRPDVEKTVMGLRGQDRPAHTSGEAWM